MCVFRRSDKPHLLLYIYYICNVNRFGKKTRVFGVFKILEQYGVSDG